MKIAKKDVSGREADAAGDGSGSIVCDLTTAGERGHDPYSRVEDELKTPLTSIRSAVEILRDNEDLPFEERKRFLDAVLQDNGRLESVVNRLLRTIENQAKRDRRHAKSLMRLGETIG